MSAQTRGLAPCDVARLERLSLLCSRMQTEAADAVHLVPRDLRERLNCLAEESAFFRGYFLVNGHGEDDQESPSLHLLASRSAPPAPGDQPSKSPPVLATIVPFPQPPRGER